MTLAPWLTPPNYLDAMKSGAGLGLERARIDTGSAEAGDRLRLAYAQLASQEERASEVAKLREQNAAESLQHQSDVLSLAREKAGQLNDYRNSRLGQFGTDEQRKQSALDELIDYRNNRLGQIDTSLAGKNSPKIHFGPNGQVLKEVDGDVTELRPRDPSAPKFTGPHTEVDADEFGPKLTGPLDNPVIKDRLAKKAQKEAADKLALAAEANKPGILSRVWHSLPGVGPSATPPQSAGDSLAVPQGTKVAKPLPKSKADLVTGDLYQTKQGEATWDGEQFVQ